jgi:hypothetical protein
MKASTKARRRGARPFHRRGGKAKARGNELREQATATDARPTLGGEQGDKTCL